MIKIVKKYILFVVLGSLGSSVYAVDMTGTSAVTEMKNTPDMSVTSLPSDVTTGVANTSAEFSPNTQMTTEASSIPSEAVPASSATDMATVAASTPADSLATAMSAIQEPTTTTTPAYTGIDTTVETTSVVPGEHSSESTVTTEVAPMTETSAPEVTVENQTPLYDMAPETSATGPSLEEGFSTEVNAEAASYTEETPSYEASMNPEPMTTEVAPSTQDAPGAEGSTEWPSYSELTGTSEDAPIEEELPYTKGEGEGFYPELNE